MPVGKAKAAANDTGGEDFKLVVPCMTSVDEANIREYLERDQFFWLDLTAPGHDDLVWLHELFGFHPLALEDTEHFGQRPKLDNYVDYIFLVFYGAWRHRVEDPEPLRERHLFISGQYLITVHRDPFPPLEWQRDQLDGRVLHSEQFLLSGYSTHLPTASSRCSPGPAQSAPRGRQAHISPARLRSGSIKTMRRSSSLAIWLDSAPSPETVSI